MSRGLLIGRRSRPKCNRLSQIEKVVKEMGSCHFAIYANMTNQLDSSSQGYFCDDKLVFTLFMARARPVGHLLLFGSTPSKISLNNSEQLELFLQKKIRSLTKG